MPDYQLGPWFSIEKDGLPVRRGVYEGTGYGIPGESYSIRQHGYYRWDGKHWVGYGGTPEAAATGGFPHQPRYWRGVIPEKGYPYDQVEPNGYVVYKGELTRESVSDALTVNSFFLTEKELELDAVRKQGMFDPQEYKCVLYRQGHEYVGHAKAKIRGFTAKSPTEIRVIQIAEKKNGIEVILVLKHRQALSFSGELKAC